MVENKAAALFSEMLEQPDNQNCADCGTIPFDLFPDKEGPSWVSVNNGVFLCFACAEEHSKLGTAISFARPTNADFWT